MSLYVIFRICKNPEGKPPVPFVYGEMDFTDPVEREFYKVTDAEKIFSALEDMGIPKEEANRFLEFAMGAKPGESRHTMLTEGSGNPKTKRFLEMSVQFCRPCSDLENGEEVVFLLYSDLYQRKIPVDGTVSFVDRDRKAAMVSWMEGYKEYHSRIAFSDLLAVADSQNGVMTKFDNIYGNSDLLFPD
jgi:hypothetical protein